MLKICFRPVEWLAYQITRPLPGNLGAMVMYGLIVLVEALPVGILYLARRLAVRTTEKPGAVCAFLSRELVAVQPDFSASWNALRGR